MEKWNILSWSYNKLLPIFFSIYVISMKYWKKATKCKSQESLKEKKKKNKSKLNQNENIGKSNRLTRSKESLHKSKNKLKSKSSSSNNVRVKGNVGSFYILIYLFYYNIYY